MKTSKKIYYLKTSIKDWKYFKILRNFFEFQENRYNFKNTRQNKKGWKVLKKIKQFPKKIINIAKIVSMFENKQRHVKKISRKAKNLKKLQ